MPNIRVSHLLARQFIFACLLFSSASASAAIITVIGTNVNFDLQYDEAELGLYGTPTIGPSGIVEFTPNFSATSVFGQGLVQTISQTTISLIAHTGFAFDGVTADEAGKYQLTGGGAFVTAGGSLDVYEGGTIAGAHEFTALTSSPTDIADGIFHAWDASASADLTGFAWDGIGTIDVVIDNTLNAFTQGGFGFNQATIQKETAGGSVSLGVDMSGGASGAVPVPAAVWLFASGLLGLLGVARRKGHVSA